MKRWPTKPLGELLKVQNGFAFKSELFNEDGKGIPIIRIRDLARGFSETFYDGENDPAFEVEKGDFLIGMDGEFRCHRWQSGRALLNQRVCRLQNFSRDLNASYVFYGINEHLRTIEANTAFVTVKHLSSKQIASIEMPVPPLAEQERIVRLLDESDELRKLRAQADRRTTALLPALFHEMFGDPVKKTSRCPIRPLGEIVTFGSGATPSKENPEFWNGYIPWVSPKDMKPQEITDTEDHVSDAAFKKSNLQLFPKDTVLIVVRGMILAHTVPVRLCRVPAAINQDMKALLPKEPIEPEFLRWSLQTQHAHLLNQVSTAGHGTKKLDSDKLREVTISVPSLPLQKEFAQRVLEIRELEAAQAASRHRLEALFQSLIHRAFNGELFASDTAAGQLGLAGMESNVVDIQELLRNKAALSAYFVSKTGQDKHRGRVKMEKFDQFVEAACDLDLGRTPQALAAGPADMASRDAVECEAQKNGWYSKQRFNDDGGKTHYEYYAGKNIAEAVTLAEQFMGAKKPAVDRLIKILKPLTTHECSVVATLHSAWSGQMKLSTPVSDDSIIKASIRFHPEKQKIPMSDWNWGLAWLRSNSLSPKIKMSKA